MIEKFNILGINGSASSNSSNLAILKAIEERSGSVFNLTLIEDLSILPHFRTDLTLNNTPSGVIEFRNQIANADGIIICTPEYVFSIPSGLKNAIEWCVATTVLSNKATGLITAAASGAKAHVELKLIMETLQANFNDGTTLLIQGVKAKVDIEGKIIDGKLEADLNELFESFNTLITK